MSLTAGRSRAFVLSWQNHNIHHLVTKCVPKRVINFSCVPDLALLLLSHVEHDPDIQHVPFFAISPIFFTSIFSTYYNEFKYFDAFARFLVPYQHKLYYFVLSLARFNLYALSYGSLVKKGVVQGKRSPFWWFEIVGIVTFWAWFGWGVLGSLKGWKEVVPYLLISHILAAPVHVQVGAPPLPLCPRTLLFELTISFVPICRSSCRTSQDRPRIWVCWSRLPIDSCARR